MDSIHLSIYGRHLRTSLRHT